MTSPQTIVIYRLGSLGDTVVALPAFHAIERAWPRAHRLVLTNFPVNSKAAPLESILGGSGLIHGAMAYPVGTRSLITLWRLRRQLRALKADTLVYLTPARGLLSAWRDWLFFKACGFRHVIGAPLSASLQTCQPQSDGLIERESKRLARCLAPRLVVDPEDPSSHDLRITAQEEDRAAQVLGPMRHADFIVVNMGGKLAVQDWGEAHWHRLLPAISARFPSLGLLIVGAADDIPRAEAALPLWQGPAINACGALSPRASSAAMRSGRLFLGHDSGPLHLAAAAGLPCIGLFGHNNPAGKWYPLGAQHRMLRGEHGIGDLEVDAVLSLCTQRIKEVMPDTDSRTPAKISRGVTAS